MADNFGLTMQDYRGYPLDDEGKVLRRHEFQAGDDADALRVARELFPGMACEVWCGSRVVGRLERDFKPLARSTGG